MSDFEALNRSRSQVLRQIREMVSAEAAAWSVPFDGLNASEVLAGIERNRACFQELWDRHEQIRQQMVDGGFMPPTEPDDLFETPLPDPVRSDIEDRLRAELEGARAEYYRVNGEFRLLATHGSGLPAPDGNLHARQVAASHSLALRKYTGAMRRFNAFLVSGDVPEE